MHCRTGHLPDSPHRSGHTHARGKSTRLGRLGRAGGPQPSAPAPTPRLNCDSHSDRSCCSRGSAREVAPRRPGGRVAGRRSPKPSSSRGIGRPREPKAQHLAQDENSPLGRRQVLQGDEGAPDASLVFEPAVLEGLQGLRPGVQVVVLTWLDRAPAMSCACIRATTSLIPSTGKSSALARRCRPRHGGRPQAHDQGSARPGQDP